MCNCDYLTMYRASLYASLGDLAMFKALASTRKLPKFMKLDLVDVCTSLSCACRKVNWRS